eukprot:TRINITY_DN35471_c0_g1_i4.p1 TRINITY_DN35471_c0_g1~~TRINITY_DN35471_c0_g1_i4.p1  ORF type:complete len:125 (+),score=14.00 TRINITY_DN35471_c0_g1_i4:275-649(+)
MDVMCLQAYKVGLYSLHVSVGLQDMSVWTSCVCRLTRWVCIVSVALPVWTSCVCRLTRHVCMDVMCLQAYKLGMYGRRFVWVLIGWYDINWWKKTDDNITCSLEEMEKALEGHFSVGIIHFNPE